jgi:hypothetical protein
MKQQKQIFMSLKGEQWKFIIAEQMKLSIDLYFGKCEISLLVSSYQPWIVLNIRLFTASSWFCLDLDRIGYIFSSDW